MNPQTQRYPASSQDMMNFITRANADQQLHVVVSFPHRMDETRLAKALRQAMDREPVLGCRFVEKGNLVFWERRADLDQLTLSQVIHTGDVQADLYEFVTHPTDPRVDPLIQARIFRSPSGDTLCLKVNHVVADGAGTKEVAYLVADTYNRLEANPAYQPEPGKPGKRSQMAIFRQVGLTNLIHFRPRKLSLPPMPFSLPFVGVEGTGRNFTIRHLSVEDSRALKGYARVHQVTLNDLVLTALYRAMFSHGNPPADLPLPVQVSIDLRHFLPQGKKQPICNLSGALYPALIYTQGETLEQTLVKVHAQMEGWKSRQPGLTGAMLIELAMLQGYAKAKQMLSRMTTIRSNRVTPLLLSNFGLLDAKRLVFGDLKIDQAFVLGPVMLGHGLMLTASTYIDQLTLAMGYCMGNIEQKQVEALLEQVQQELAAFTKPGAVHAGKNLFPLTSVCMS
jgi:NRPS condensation-like uncharacterized protein